jgi:3-hydroxyisobutyrate dehydrogenase-like beta-hydroxyacid dehydrogenase
VLVSDQGVDVLSSVRGELATQLPEYMQPRVLGYVDQPVLTSTGKTNESQLLALLGTAYRTQPSEQYVFSAEGAFVPHCAQAS